MRVRCAKHILAFSTCFAGCFPLLAAPIQKRLTGTVTAAHSRPLQDAVVKLQNTKSRRIRSYITGADGKYHFLRLQGDIDYRVWATYRRHDTAHQEVSRFDSDPNPVVDLSVDIP